MNQNQNQNLSKFQAGEPKPNVVKFSENWNNKLDCDFFTTIRKPDNFAYYSSRIGETFDVMLDGVKHSEAILLDSAMIDIGDITPELLVLDTGTMEYKTLFEKFGIKDKAVFCLFKKIKPMGE